MHREGRNGDEGETTAVNRPAVAQPCMQPRRREKRETAASCWTSGSLLHATETRERDDGGKASDGAGWRLIRRAVDGVRPCGREEERKGSPERRGKGRGGHRMERERERERVRERESQGEREKRK